MDQKLRKAAAYIAAAVLTGVLLFLLQRLLMPKYVDKVVEGAFIAEYYREEKKDFNVVFLGDCEVYENFSPVSLWQEYGINSYVRGSAEQYIWQSYYLLEDTLRYEKPDVVVFNIQSLQFDKSQNEAYNRMSIEGMRWSMSKVNCIRASMLENEHFIEYVFPILRYHTRWNELGASDLEYMFKTKKVSHNGYYMRIDEKAAGTIPKGRPLGDYNFGKNAWKYLEMMADLCEKEGIKLLLIKAPSLYPYWYEEWEEQVEEFAASRGLRYVNFLEYIDEIGLDYDHDTYDGGLHMNLSGAEKCSHFIGKILTDDFEVPDRRGESALEKIWDENIADYNDEIARQKVLYGL